MKTNNYYIIQAIEPNNLSQVAEIHKKSFPRSLLCKFGDEVIIQYYQWQMDPPNICYAVGVFVGEDVLGFCFAGSLRNSEIYYLQENLSFFIRQFIRQPTLIFHQQVLSRIGSILVNFKNHLIKGDWKRSIKEQVKRERFGILSIAIDPGKQGAGLGKMLMDVVEKTAINQGYQKMNLSVHPENAAAVNFYEKLGWQKVYYDHDIIWQGYMEKQLGSSKHGG